MGKGSSKIQIHDLDPDEYYDEIIQNDECCGFQRKRTIKKGLIWETNFKHNCEQLLMFYDWVHDLQEAVKLHGRKLPRKKFIQEVIALRTSKTLTSFEQNDVLLSPSQIDEFKVNLKKSVLLSYGQAMKSSRQKESSRIDTLIFNTNAKKLNLTASFSSPPSHRKKSQISSSEVRRDSILKEREKALRQSYSKNGLRDSIMSFVDQTMSTLFRGQQKQISKQSAHSLETFLKFSLILQNHLSSKDHICYAIIETFSNYIYKKYTIFENSECKDEGESERSQQKQVLCIQQIEEKVKSKVKKERFKQLQKRKNLSNDEIQDLTTDVKIFLVLLREIVQDYYKTYEFSHQFVTTSEDYSQDTTQRTMNDNLSINNLITNEDNILILVTAILFKNHKFYAHLMAIFYKFHEDRQRNFKQIIQNLKDRQPQYFQIKAEYCLNELTIQKFSSLSPQKEQNILDQLQDKSGKVTKNMSQSSIQMKKNHGYHQCAEALSKISKSKTPSSKMKVILECSQKITESVAEFYNQNSLLLKNNVLDADQVLSIFCYILATNQFENIHANLFLIQHFATENQMISVTGYYYSVLTIALEQLQNMYGQTVAQIDGSSISERITERQRSIKSKKTGSPTKDKNKLKRSFVQKS